MVKDGVLSRIRQCTNYLSHAPQQAMESCRDDGSSSNSKSEGSMVILVPLPFQGHVPPMLQLATLLHRRGFSITIVHPRFNSPDSSYFPNFHFHPIDDCIKPDQSSLHVGEVFTLIKAINDNCADPFREFVKKLMHEKKGSTRIHCVISDVSLYFTQSVASQLKLPRLGLNTSSLTSFLAAAEFLLNRRSSIDQGNDGVLQSIRENDIPEIKMAKADELTTVVEQVFINTKASSGLIWNTFDELEKESLVEIRKEYKMPIFTVGPLHKTPMNSTSSLSAHDQSCMDWLDKQAPNSVLYVSFGSIASLSKEELTETAWGLANSEQPFIWVVRKGLTGDGAVELPNRFMKETMNRGIVVEWAPQPNILVHRSVGGFWTHCGWNSTLEGICEGVPLICWPSFGDQKVNARYASHVWKVGIQVENGLERAEIERAVRKLMVGKEGEEMRERVKALQYNAQRSLGEGGSSVQSLNNLVDWIHAL